MARRVWVSNHPRPPVAEGTAYRVTAGQLWRHFHFRWLVQITFVGTDVMFRVLWAPNARVGRTMRLSKNVFRTMYRYVDEGELP